MLFTINGLLTIFGIFGLTTTVIFTIVLLAIYRILPSKNPLHFKGKHAFITGGSKGIGKQLALGLVQRGCSVSISARDRDLLISTCAELNSFAKSIGSEAITRWYELDVTESFEKVESVILNAEKEGGPIDILINNAGTCVQGAFDELPSQAFGDQLLLNCLSAVKTTRAVMNRMKRERRGHIGFVCSAAGQFAMFGYSAYSMSKFALRGFAESLRMELLPYNIGISILFPPNTNTDGYQVELQTMPEEVKEIGGAAGLFTPHYVAECYLNDIAAGNFATSIGLESHVLTALASSTSMENKFTTLIFQVLFLGAFRCAILFYICHFNRIVNKYRIKRELANTSRISE